MTTIMALSNGMVLSRKSEEEKTKSLAPQDVQAGSYFTHDGKIARVRKSKSSERFYAEAFNEELLKFEYSKGLVFNLAKRMTLDEAKAWGARLGHCAVCGKKLTDNKSVDNGIGPVCIKKL